MGHVTLELCYYLKVSIWSALSIQPIQLQQSELYTCQSVDRRLAVREEEREEEREGVILDSHSELIILEIVLLTQGRGSEWRRRGESEWVSKVNK